MNGKMTEYKLIIKIRAVGINTVFLVIENVLFKLLSVFISGDDRRAG